MHCQIRVTTNRGSKVSIIDLNTLLKDISPDFPCGEELNSPIKLVEQAGRCRVVVTGAYHIGVFALSQGIPVICLALSTYFKQKFYGLQELFGDGCVVFRLDKQRIDRDFLKVLSRIWDAAPSLRESLLRSAERQAQRANHAYEAFLTGKTPHDIPVGIATLPVSENWDS